MPDVTACLRAWVAQKPHSGYVDGIGDLRRVAADTIEAQAAEIARLTDAAQGLAEALDDIADGCHCTKPDPWAIGQCDCQTNTARAALAAWEAQP